MARGIPSNIIKKLYSKNIDSAFLTVLTVYADDEIIRLVNNEEDITYKDTVYSAAAFTVVYPDDSPDSIPQASIVFADISNVFIDIVRNYDEIYCDLELIAAKVDGSTFIKQGMADSTLITVDTSEYTADATLWNDDYPVSAPIDYGNRKTITVYETEVGPYEMTLTNAEATAGTVSFSISYDDVGEYAFPAMKFNSYDFPAIF